MQGFNNFKAPRFIIEKINSLCQILWQSKRDYELAAENLTDKESCSAVLTLAQGNNQYACELSSQMQSLGGRPPKEIGSDTEATYAAENCKDERAVLAFCRTRADKIVEAYHNTLREPNLYVGLKKMMQYQLEGILHAFVQIELLNALKFPFV